MLGIDEGSNTASLLSLCDGMDGQCCLTRRFRTIDLDDTSPWITAYAQCIVESDTTRRNYLDILDVLIAEFHDRALAEVFLNLRHGCLEGFQFSLVGGQFALFYLFCHILLMF